ncbi:MAG: SurA N-terminal domain-containing protein [Thermodesulfovibrionales bacterium]
MALKFSDMRRLSRSLMPLLVLFLFSGSSYAAVLLDRVVAVVNKEVITWSELYRAMEFEASSDMKSLSYADKMKIFKENEAHFLESMVDMKLQLQAARKLDIDASKDEVSEAIEGIKKKYSMGDKEFNESLKKEGFTIEEYKKRLAEQIILSKVVAQQVRNKIVVSDEEVKEYMAKNRDMGYRVRQIFFRKPGKEVDRKVVEEKAEALYQRLKAGDDFSSLAKQYSEDPTGKTGGDLGYIKKEHLGKEFAAVISTMNVGDVSRPFWTDQGLHIVKLEDRPDTRDMDEARKRLQELRFNEAYRNWIRSLRERAYVEVRL